MAVFGYYCYSAAELSPRSMDPDKLGNSQSRSIGIYCRKHGWQTDEIFHDIGGKWLLAIDKRKQFSQLYQRLKPGDIIVCQSLERIFGSIGEFCEMLKTLRRKRVRLFVTTLDSDITSGECALPLDRMLESLASMEKRRSAENIRNIKIRERKKGRYLGGTRPFGYMIHQNGMLIENPMEQKVVQQILRLKEEGLSLRAIAGKVTKPATPISFKTVQRVLRRQEERS